MRIPTVVGIAALGAAGGFLYLHKRRGGELTVDSFKQTARELLGQAKTEARELKERAEKAEKTTLHEVAAKIEEATQRH